MRSRTTIGPGILARAAEVHERTARRWLRGLPVRGISDVRMRRAVRQLEELGFVLPDAPSPPRESSP